MSPDWISDILELIQQYFLKTGASPSVLDGLSVDDAMLAMIQLYEQQGIPETLSEATLAELRNIVDHLRFLVLNPPAEQIEPAIRARFLEVLDAISTELSLLPLRPFRNTDVHGATTTP